MVRFKLEAIASLIKRFEMVTIPLWFDSNDPKLGGYVVSVSRHNSTMVRFKRYLECWTFCKTNCHNSTMVRFKLEIKRIIIMKFLLKVTIPLWFDSNLSRRVESKEFELESQFHYGSIQT